MGSLVRSWRWAYVFIAAVRQRLSCGWPAISKAVTAPIPELAGSAVGADFISMATE
ncbi:MAG: hypothetical protein JWM99_461 [Verrucomicrobiales bacterium]|nr:hypothetical protein [Verrucomicrobiales bacterium]